METDAVIVKIDVTAEDIRKWDEGKHAEFPVEAAIERHLYEDATCCVGSYWNDEDEEPKWHVDFWIEDGDKWTVFLDEIPNNLCEHLMRWDGTEPCSFELDIPEEFLA